MIDFNEDFRINEALVGLNETEVPASSPTMAPSKYKANEPDKATYIFLEVLTAVVGFMILNVCVICYRYSHYNNNVNSNNALDQV